MSAPRKRARIHHVDGGTDWWLVNQLLIVAVIVLGFMLVTR